MLYDEDYIRKACEKIRESWSEKEERQRRVAKPSAERKVISSRFITRSVADEVQLYSWIPASTPKPSFQETVEKVVDPVEEFVTKFVNFGS